MTWMAHYKAEILKDLGGYIMTDKDRLEQAKYNESMRMEYDPDIKWLIEQAEQNQKLREALEFYEDESNYSQDPENPILNDAGKLARKTLEELK